MRVRHHKFIVLGGGISGLTAAAELEKRGHDVLLIEQQSGPGGVLQSVSCAGFVWDRAAHTIAADDKVIDFFQRHDLTHLVQEPAAVAKVRQLVIHEQIQTVESHPLKILSAPFLSFGARISIVKELFKRPIDLENPTVEQFFKYHFGTEITRNVVSAVFSGIYAGDINTMEMKSVMGKVFEMEQEKGSVIRGLSGLAKKGGGRKIIGIRGGMKELSTQLARRIRNAVFDCKIRDICRLSNGFQVNTDMGKFVCDQLISTLPAYAISSVVEKRYLDLASLLKSVDYAPLLLAHVAFQKRAEGQQAFGFLCSQYSSSMLKGAIYNSQIFPDRAPEDQESCTLFVKYNPELAIETAISEAVAEFKALCNIDGEVNSLAHTAWDKAIPQFNKPYLLRKEEMLNQAEFHLSGSFISGVSVTDCIKFNVELVSKL